MEEEKLMRLSYVDKLLNDFNNEKADLKLNDLKESLSKAKAKVSKMSVGDMEKEVSSQDKRFLPWLTRFRSSRYTLKKINPKLLCTDDFHNILDDIAIQRGKLLIDFLRENKDNPETKRRNNFIKKFSDFFISETQIIVRKYGDLFEVMQGNHRGMVAITLGLEKLEVLLILPDK